jgi:hypothetical protein
MAWNARKLVRLGRELERQGLDVINWSVRKVEVRSADSLPGEVHEVLELKFDDLSTAAAFRISSSLCLFTTRKEAEAWLLNQTSQPFI